MKMRIAIGIIIPSLAIVLYLLGASWVSKITVELVKDEQLNHYLKFQLYGLMLSLIVLVITISLAPQSKKYLRFGDLSNRSQPVKLLGIKATHNWRKTGLSYLIGITITTGVYLYAGLGETADWYKLTSIFPYVILLSIINSFNEEIITRFAVVGLLEGQLKAIQIIWVSAFIFGAIHYFGNPGGPVGMVMAGFLGWLLSKSIIETQGIGIAWGIHLIQDIVIYGLILIQATK